MATTNLTYIQARELFSDFATRHLQVNSFYFGDLSEIGNDVQFQYPLLAIIPSDVRMVKSNQSYNQIEYRFVVVGGDLLNADRSNESEVRSDILQILQDLISEFNQAAFYNNNTIIINSDAIFKPFIERFDDLITGFAVNVSIKVPYRTTPCDAPLSSQKSGQDLNANC